MSFVSAKALVDYSVRASWRDLEQYADELASMLLAPQPVTPAALATPAPKQPSRKRAAAIPLDVLHAQAAALTDDEPVAAAPAVTPTASPSAHSQVASRLSADQHRQWCSVVSRRRSDQPIDATEEKAFNEMRVAVAQEQEAYRAAQLSAAQRSSGRYLHLDESVDACVHRILQAKKSSTLPFYPRYFESRVQIPLRATPVSATTPTFHHKMSLFRTGTCVCLNDDLPESLSPTMDWFAPDPAPQSSATKVPMPAVSQDPVVSRLLSDGRAADIAISSSALCALIAAVSSSSVEFDIPITVRATGNGSGRTAFVDKPLPRLRYSAREKNQIYFKGAAAAACLDRTGTPALTFKPLSTLLSEPVAADVAQEEGEETSQLGENAARLELRLSRGLNLTYNLWSFGNISLLVRCRIHGVVKDETSVYKKLRMVGMAAKMEYLTGDAQESVPVEEAARWWMHTYIRPDAHLLVAHVDATTSALLGMERLDMPAIVGIQEAFSPASACSALLPVFERLAAAAPGEYILSRTAGAACAVLQRGVEKADGSDRTLFDLHQRLQGAGATSSNLHFVPPRWDGPPDQIPDTFPPRADAAVQQKQQKRPAKRNAKKRK